MIQALLRSRAGHTSIEYGLIVASLALLIVTAVGMIGTSVEQMLMDAASGFAAAAP